MYFRRYTVAHYVSLQKVFDLNHHLMTNKYVRILILLFQSVAIIGNTVYYEQTIGANLILWSEGLTEAVYLWR